MTSVLHQRVIAACGAALGVLALGATPALGQDLAGTVGQVTGATQPVAPVVKQVTAPVEQVTAPVVKNVAPVVDQATAPVTKNVVAPATKPVEPVAKTVVAPVAKTVVAPVAKTVVAPVVKTVAPVVEKATAPVTNNVVAPLTKTVKPVVETVSRTVAPVVEQTVAPVVKLTVAPVVETVSQTAAPIVKTVDHTLAPIVNRPLVSVVNQAVAPVIETVDRTLALRTTDPAAAPLQLVAPIASAPSPPQPVSANGAPADVVKLTPPWRFTRAVLGSAAYERETALQMAVALTGLAPRSQASTISGGARGAAPLESPSNPLPTDPFGGLGSEAVATASGGAGSGIAGLPTFFFLLVALGATARLVLLASRLGPAPVLSLPVPPG